MGQTRKMCPYFRSFTRVGYKVHLTESCDEDVPHLITHVETSRAGNGDVDVTPVIHQALKDKDLLPTEHLIFKSKKRAAFLCNWTLTQGTRFKKGC